MGALTRVFWGLGFEIVGVWHGELHLSLTIVNVKL